VWCAFILASPTWSLVFASHPPVPLQVISVNRSGEVRFVPGPVGWEHAAPNCSRACTGTPLRIRFLIGSNQAKNSRRAWQAGGALLKAAGDGDAAEVQKLIASGADVNFANEVSLPTPARFLSLCFLVFHLDCCDFSLSKCTVLNIGFFKES
jgi:hypothetical protein